MTTPRPITSDAVATAIIGLSRIHGALYTAEQALRRRRTPGRVKSIQDAQDSIAGWDAHQLEVAASIGVNLSRIANEASASIFRLIEAGNQT